MTPFAAIVFLTCLLSTTAWTNPMPTPPPVPPVQTTPNSHQIWQAMSPLNHGKILYRAAGTRSWREWRQGTPISPGSVEFKIRVYSDHRWTKYGRFSSTLNEKGLTLTIPRWTDKRLHDASFQPSLWTSEVVQVRIPQGKYQFILGEKALGVLKVKS